MVEIGKIENVPVRELWPHEAHDFTPWLAANLSLLGDALDLSLELKQTEAASGAYSLDILAIETDRGCNVAIENQLETTNHGHLGQLITYATAHDARIAIWIAPSFQPEHRAAIDWLNRWMSDGIDFYAVEVRAISIDDSRPAVEFRPVAFPESRNWSKRRGRGSASPEIARNRKFFKPLVDKMIENGWIVNRRYTEHSLQSFNSGFDGIFWCARADADSAKVHIGWLPTRNAEMQSVFDALDAKSEGIKSELGVPADSDAATYWEPRGRHSYAELVVTKTGVNWDDESTHDEIREWLEYYLNRFCDVFTPHLERIIGEPSGDAD